MTSGILLQASIIPCPEEQPVTTKSTVLLANKIPTRIEISIYEYFSFSSIVQPKFITSDFFGAYFTTAS